MPSPFTRYQSEQVPLTNILQANAQVAENLRSGLANLGAGIGASIKKYQEAQQEHDVMARMAYGAMADKVTTDQNANDGVGELVLDPTAPQHHHQLWKKVMTAGGGDYHSEENVLKGLAGVSTADLKAWMGLQQKWEVDEDKRKNEVFKNAEADLAKRRLGLEAERFKLDKDRYDFEKGRVLETRAKEDFIEQVQAQEASPTRNIEKPIVTLEPIGDVFGEDGELIASNIQLRDGIPALGLDPKKVLTETAYLELQAKKNDYPRVATLKWITGSDNFDPSKPLSENQVANREGTMKFIRNTWARASELSPQVAQQFAVYFPNGLNGDIKGLNKAYEIAQKFVSDPRTLEGLVGLGKRYGVGQVPPNAIFNKAHIVQTGVDERKDKVITTVGVNEWGMEMERFQKASALYPAGKAPIKSFAQYLALQPNRFFPHKLTPAGKLFNVGGEQKPQWITEAQLNAGQFTAEKTEPESMGQIDARGFNSWLQSYRSPKEFSFGSVQFAPNGKPNADWTDFQGRATEDYPIIRDGFRDMGEINDIANRMIEMTKAPLTDKVLPEWRKEFANLNLRAQTFRKHFIASGQETDKDNARLLDLLADADLWNTLHPDTHRKIIENFRTIINNKVVGTATQAGFTVKLKNQKPEKGMSPEETRKFLANLKTKDGKKFEAPSYEEVVKKVQPKTEKK